MGREGKCGVEKKTWKRELWGGKINCKREVERVRRVGGDTEAGIWRGKERGKRYVYEEEKWNRHPKWKGRQGQQWKGWNRVQLIWMALILKSFDSLSPYSALTVPEPTNASIWDGDWLKSEWSHLKFSPTYCHSQETRVKHDSFNLVVLSHSPIVCFSHTCHFLAIFLPSEPRSYIMRPHLWAWKMKMSNERPIIHQIT